MPTMPTDKEIHTNMLILLGAIGMMSNDEQKTIRNVKQQLLFVLDRTNDTKCAMAALSLAQGEFMEKLERMEADAEKE